MFMKLRKSGKEVKFELQETKETNTILCFNKKQKKYYLNLTSDINETSQSKVYFKKYDNIKFYVKDKTSNPIILEGTVLYFTNGDTKKITLTDEKFEKHQFKDNTTIIKVTSTDAVRVQNSTFRGCVNLQTVVIPKLLKISSYGFLGCSSLKEVIFPTLFSISRQAFRGCTSIKSVVIPKCTSIGMYAFSDCDKLTTLVLNESIEVSDILGSGVNESVKIYNQNKTLVFNLTTQIWENI